MLLGLGYLGIYLEIYSFPLLPSFSVGAQGHPGKSFQPGIVQGEIRIPINRDKSALLIILELSIAIYYLKNMKMNCTEPLLYHRVTEEQIKLCGSCCV